MVTVLLNAFGQRYQEIAYISSHKLVIVLIVLAASTVLRVGSIILLFVLLFSRRVASQSRDTL